MRRNALIPSVALSPVGLGDSNVEPTGGTRQVQYKLPPRGEQGGSWRSTRSSSIESGRALKTPARRTVRGLLATLACGMLPPCPTPALAQGTEAAEQVKARETAFARTMAERDLEAFLGFVSPEAVFFRENEPLRGRDAIARAWSPFFEGPEAPFSWYPDVVEVLDSGGLAFSSGPVLGASGEPIGRFNSIWRRDADGQWRVVFDKGS